VRALNDIATERGQTLAQMAISWVLRDKRMTSALIGASSVAQLEENLAAAAKTSFTDAEVAAIEHLGGVKRGLRRPRRDTPACPRRDTPACPRRDKRVNSPQGFACRW
jgi:diketogulonate reductase-like aldo/keto reductase